MTKPAIKWDLG